LARTTRRRILWLAVLAITVAVIATHSLWLAAVGRFLVQAESPAPADAVLVLAGDGYGRRILKGAEVVRLGYAPRVFVSGPPGFYGSHECDLAIPFAVRHGYPESYFVPFPHEARSTEEEAHAILPELRRQGVRKLLLVTSDYHTRRAGATFRAAGSGIGIIVVAAPDVDFAPERWWKSRQGQKCVFFEVTKSIAAWIGL